MPTSTHRPLRKVLNQRKKAGRSRLFHQMRGRSDELAKAQADAVAKDGRPLTWGEFGQLVRFMGMTDAKGKPPSDETVRKAWLRVTRMMDRAARPLIPKPTEVPQRVLPPVAPAVVQAPDFFESSIENEEIDEPKQQFTFRPARPR